MAATRLISIIMLSLCCLPGIIWSQKTIAGTVKDERGQPIFAANVFLKNNQEIGATTELDGSFQLQVPQLTDTLVISYLGFEDVFIPLHDKILALEVKLRESANVLTTLQIEAKRPVAQEFALVELSKLDVYTIPFSFADPLKATSILPSSTNTDESANVSLRGSSSERGIVVLNGVPIANPVRATNLDGNGFFSIFNPEIAEKISVYASNPSLAYGNATSGMVEIETAEQVEENFTQASLGLANFGLFHGRKLGKKHHVFAYTNNQYSDAFLQVNTGSFPQLRSFRVNDAGILWNAQLKPNMNLSWYAYGLRENNALQLNLFGQQDDAESLARRHFQVAKLHWYNTDWSFTVNAAGDFSRNEFRFGNLDNRERNQRWYGSFNARYNVINNWYLQGGITSEHTQLRLQGQVAERPFNFAAEAPTRSLNQERSNNNTELYLISRSKWFDKKFSFITGLRKNIPTSALQNSYFSRQYIAKYNFPSKHAITATFGNYNGYFNPDLFNPEFVQVSARQGALEYEYRSKKLEINAAVFGKTETGGFNQLLQLANFAEQRIQGLELLWKYRWSPSFECWLSSAYLNVENRNAEGLNFRGSNDLDYFLRLFLTYQDEQGWNASVAWVHRQGLWYTPILGGSSDPASGINRPVFGDANSAQFNNYHNISLNLSKMIKTKAGSLLCYATLNNAFNFLNEQAQLLNAAFSPIGFEYLQQRSVYFGVVYKW